MFTIYVLSKNSWFLFLLKSNEYVILIKRCPCSPLHSYYLNTLISLSFSNSVSVQLLANFWFKIIGTPGKLGTGITQHTMSWKSLSLSFGIFQNTTRVLMRHFRLFSQQKYYSFFSLFFSHNSGFTSDFYLSLKIKNIILVYVQCKIGFPNTLVRVLITIIVWTFLPYYL